MSEAWEKVKLLTIPHSVGIFPVDSWWYVMRALKLITIDKLGEWCLKQGRWGHE